MNDLIELIYRVDIFIFLAIVVVMILADICWVFYFINIDERNSVKSGLWGSMVYVCSAISITNYINNKAYIVAAVLGSFIGTYASVEYKKWKENKL
jgi:hypothetical protein